MRMRVGWFNVENLFTRYAFGNPLSEALPYDRQVIAVGVTAVDRGTDGADGNIALAGMQRDNTARVILDKYFEPERLCAIIDAKYALIKEDLATDPFPHRRVTSPDDRDYADIVESMKKFVRARRGSTSRQALQPQWSAALSLAALRPSHAKALSNSNILLALTRPP